MTHDIPKPNIDSEPSEAGLSVALRAVIDKDIKQGHSGGIAAGISEVLEEGKKNQLPTYVADQMVAIVKYLEENDTGLRPDAPDSQRRGGTTRLLSVFDQTSFYPDQVDRFLEDPIIMSSNALKEQVVLETIAIRQWNNGADASTTVKLLSFTLDQSADNNAIIARFVGGISGGIKPGREEEMGNLLTLLPDILTADQSKAFFDRIEFVWQEGARRQKEKAAKDHERAKKLADKARKAEEQEREANRRSVWIEAIKQDPGTAYADYFHGQEYAQDQASSSILPLLASSQYLLSEAGEIDVENEATAHRVLDANFQSLLQSDNLSHIYNDRRYRAIEPHLWRLVPDIEALKQLVLQYPGLVEQDKFYQDWKEAYTSGKLNKKANELIGILNVEGMCEQGIVGLDVTLRHLGVPYDGIEALEEDLRKYFVYSIGDLTQAKIDHTVAVTGTPPAVAALPRWARSDEEVLQDDVIKPFQEWINNRQYEKELPSEDGHYVFIAKETANGGHIITIATDMSGERPVFYLSIHGGEHDTDAFLGERFEKFATFVDKEIAYPNESTISIRPNVSTLRRSDQQLAQQEAELRASGEAPDVEVLDGNGQRNTFERWQAERWNLPYDKTPNGTMAATLRQVVGSDVPVYYSTQRARNLGYDKPDLMSAEGPEEARLVFQHLTTTLDGQQEQTDYLRVMGVARFVIPSATPEQARKLKSTVLSYWQGRISQGNRRYLIDA